MSYLQFGMRIFPSGFGIIFPEKNLGKLRVKSGVLGFEPVLVLSFSRLRKCFSGRRL
jgi:hypothetical protein